MPVSNLAEVGARLEEAVRRLPSVDTPLEKYQQYEMIAIAILDSEHDNFEDNKDGEFTDYLLYYLADIAEKLKVTVK
jgi:hypothetical protein